MSNAHYTIAYQCYLCHGYGACEIPTTRFPLGCIVVSPALEYHAAMADRAERHPNCKAKGGEGLRIDVEWPWGVLEYLEAIQDLHEAPEYTK